jgi:hypothetical protein
MILHDLLNDEILEKIGKMVIKPVDQHEKADYYKKILKKLDFKELDMGTNRQIFTHNEFPKVVFKVALDEQGVSDNLNEYEKSAKHSAFPTSHDIDADGYILVQTKKKTFSLNEFYAKDTQKAVRKLLQDLDKAGFVLVDLGTDKPKNYGRDKNGNISVIDFGYVEYKSLAEFRCPHQALDNDYKQCKGTLEYNKTFTMMQCPKCGNVFSISVLMEGYNSDMYAVPPRTDYFELTPELAEFYRSYKTTRHKSDATSYNDNLKEYVKITRDKTPKGESGMVSVKDMWKKKLGGSKQSDDSRQDYTPSSSAGPSVDIWQKKRGGIIDITPEYREETPQRALTSGNDVVEAALSDLRKYNVHPDETEVDDAELQEQSRLAEEEERRMLENLKSLNNRPVAHVEPESSPVEVQEAQYVKVTDTPQPIAPPAFDWSKASEHIGDLSKTDALGLIQMIHARFGTTPEPVATAPVSPQAEQDQRDVAKDAGITMLIPNGYSNEIHIGMVVEDLKRHPIIVASANGTVFTIDLVEHLKRLVEYLPPDHMDDMIVSSMVAKPIREFNKDYDGQYFEGEGNN